mgnify:CR=1|tara:strand:- start:148 stop:369 length:222 start_codon:yes stop_codon:yes gene_type:complete
MKFKNNQPIDVYIDLGTLRRVSPGEEIDLPGALICAGLTPVQEAAPAKPKPVKKPAPKKAGKTTKNIDTSGTI